MDDPIQYDSDILIANPSNQRFEIMLDKTQEKEFDFTEIVN
ncbi:hypothetical protein JCM19237_5559 [Photobacterium aphoticum]|uniref:Uncharacterized protein n=1 Tax=Photobacterium aphoticum TaxID=754436 RepID=A0A090QIA3_9GAMM|nr:hypothetical protein JCM19237_5559 [Photobacterium aphoticum]